MKKLALDLNQLQVESFETSEARRPEGTVEGYESTGCGTIDVCCAAGTEGGRTCDTTCNQIICVGCSGATICDVTCNGTCTEC
jgi:hypothetical protein